MKPKVSICIPAFKQVEYLRKTLNSIVIQNYKDYEIIITDDSPSDSVRQLLDTYDFKKIKYFRNKERKNAPENWNEAVRQSSGVYIKMLHHDDWFTYEDSLQEYVKMLDDNPEADFAFSSTLVQYPDNTKSRIPQVTPKQIALLKNEPTSLFCGNIIGGPSATLYRKKVNKLYDINLKWVVDIDFYISILNDNNFFIHNSRTLITNLRGTGDAITDDSINNKSVEIYEYCYLFNKIKKIIPIRKIKKYLFFLFEFVIKYKIKSPKEIKACGYNATIPYFILLLLFLNNISPLLRRIFVKAYKSW